MVRARSGKTVLRNRKRLRKLLRKAAKNLANLTGADQTGFEADDELEETSALEEPLAASA